MQPELDQPDTLPLHVQLLLHVRARHHWTQAALAQQLGVSLSTIANWEAGRHDPHPVWLRTLRDLLVT